MHVARCKGFSHIAPPMTQSPKLTLLAATCGILLASAGIGCSSSSTPATSTATPDAGAVAPTFTNVYDNVIAKRCTGCHTTPTGDGIAEGKLDMTTKALAFTNLVGAAAAGPECAAKQVRVVPGKPDDSLFYLKISLDDAAPCDKKMPENGPPLSQADADLIEAWITAGAKND